ncbi:MAG: thiamine phosphate synthase [Firmicutes bacterium]|nr:thiamine phosphate synthase [Bacillota bacterium]MCM1401392.1 thiamine phosphate synthase [Bacteroides sp.]MCM1477338.1 thiamine phosphate synthase [Bacteroides sp.]
MVAESPFKILITPEEISRHETAFIVEALNAGWNMVHLRHPDASTRDMRNLIEAIPQNYHSRLRLHGHFELLTSFNLGGVHLNHRCPQAPAFFSGNHSRSCHSFDEVRSSGQCDYVTLSPIFNSISKNGYNARFDKKELTQISNLANSIVNTKLLALGGISPQTAREALELGFDGYAVLGYLMNASSLQDFRQRLHEFD